MMTNTTAEPAELLHGSAAIGRYLGITPRQAKHWAAAGRIPTFKVGRDFCARRSTLAGWLEAQERAAVTPPPAPPAGPAEVP